MLTKLLMLALPACGVIVFVVKIPPRFKNAFFKCPIWLSSTLMALFMAHFLTGVMAVPAAILCDFILMPAFMAIKKVHEYRKSKGYTYPKAPRKARALVAQNA